MEQSDSVFFRTFGIVLALLVAIAIGVFVLAQKFSTQEPLPRQTSAANIERVSEVSVASKVLPRGKSPAQMGAVCMGCHNSGAAGAPKISDKATWTERLKKNKLDGMVKTVIKGKGAMPPKGGTALSDGEIKQVVEYMLKQAGVK